MTISPNASTVWRNYVTDGVPSSGNNKVGKAAVRTWGAAVETAIYAYSSGAGSIAKATRALLYADLAHAADVMAWVYADSTVAYNGIYRKSGGTGTGSWSRILDLPYDTIIATDAGAGTANAIVATSTVPVSESALILLNVFEANTATPVTVAFNGGGVLTIKTAAGNDVVIGGLVSGMALLGKITGSTFRMVSDQASAAILAACEAAKDAAEAAQAAAEVAAASINQRIYTTMADAEADTILASVKRVQLQFRTSDRIPSSGFHARRASLADLTGYPIQSYFRSADLFMPDGTTDATNGGYWVIDEREPTVTMFGAIGDAATDDSAAIQGALTWWGISDNRTIIFDQGKRFLMNSGVSVNCDGLASAGSIIMHGSVKSAANVAALFTFTNVRGGKFGLKVYGGGQTADYTLSDPDGKNEAFRFVNAYGSVIEYAEGMEYAGRVLRITSATPGSGGFQSQWLEIKKIDCNSTAVIGAAEATRLANGVGQSFYIDTDAAAFGTIGEVFTLWEKYGPVIEDTTDVTIMDLESLWRGNTGMELRGVISFWGGRLKLGSELAGWTGNLLNIKSSDTRNSQNIHIETCFAVGGYNGVRAHEVGVSQGPGLSIRALFSRLNTNRGLVILTCSEFDIGLLSSYADFIALELAETNSNGKIRTQITASKRQAIVVSSSTGNVEFTGSALDGNTDAAATTSLIDINTTNPIFFNGFYTSSANVDYLFDIVASNITRIRNGRLVVAGGSAIFNNDPNRAGGNVGLVTESSSISTVLSGTASCVVNHGLVKAPQWVGLTSRTSTSVDLYVTNITATQFTINVSAVVGSDTPVLWDAKVDYHG